MKQEYYICFQIQQGGRYIGGLQFIEQLQLIYRVRRTPALWQRGGGEGAVFFTCIEARAGLGGGSGHLAVTLDNGVGE